MYLAVWIALSVNIGKSQQCVDPDGGHSHVRACNTIYSAIAFAIVNWLLHTVTLAAVTFGILTGGGEDEVAAPPPVASGPGPLKSGNDEMLSPA